MFDRHRYDERSDLISNIENPVYMKKYDGANFFMKIGEGGQPSFTSRRKSVDGTFPDRTVKLPELANLRFPAHVGKVFNVELHHTGMTPEGKDNHPAVSGILNSLPARAIETQKQIGPIRAKVFDVIDKSIPTYQHKLDVINALIKDGGRPDLLGLPEMAFGHEEGKKLVKATEQRGDEGIIATSLTTPEAQNRRYKLKHIQTYNLMVSRVLQEFDISGNAKDQAGSLEVIDANGRVVGNVSGFTQDQKKHFWQNKDKTVGSAIQVRAYPTTARRLRSPQYNGEADGDIDVVEPLK